VVGNLQSSAFSLAADRVSAAAAYPTTPRKTRAWGSRCHPSGRNYRRGRFRSMFTPGSRACVYKTASGRSIWPNRDPINEPGFNLLTGKSGAFDLDEEKAIYCFVRNEPISRSDVLGLGLCAPLIWRAGCIEFVGCSAAQLSDFRVIPESKTGTMTTPSNGWNCNADGFWSKGNANWFKVPGNCYTKVTCSPGGGFSTSCCCNACLSAVRWVLGKASCGYQPNSGTTSIAPHNYPF
jgi:hypothetical protein